MDKTKLKYTDVSFLFLEKNTILSRATVTPDYFILMQLIFLK